MTRNYEYFDAYLNSLFGDIYDQPTDPGHTKMSLEVIDNWIPKLVGCGSVVDMGCGQVAPQGAFEKYGVTYLGVAIGRDVVVAREEGKNVINADMSFTDLETNSFDLVYSRHSLEHSPFPLLTLMEWRRVAKTWLLIVVPRPDFFGRVGKNHYSVFYHDQWVSMLERAGWQPIWTDGTEPQEYRFMCQKVQEKKE
jgi:hypothetical protein